MVFLVLLFIAWAVLVLPNARKAPLVSPWKSARRYRNSMLLVAPPTRADIRRATRTITIDPKLERTRSRRREIIVFLGSGALSAAVVAAIGDRPGAWPVAGLFAGLFLMYTAAIAEADRRKVARRIEERRRAREAKRAAEPGYAEAV